MSLLLNAPMYVASKGCEEIVSLFLKQKKLNIFLRSEPTGLDPSMNAEELAKNGGHTKVAKMIEGARLSRELINAVAKNDLVTTQKIVAMEHPYLNINWQDEQGWTAFMFACMKGDTAIVDTLLRYSRIDLNLQNEHGWTALMMAVQEQHKKIVKKLINDDGVSTDLQTQEGLTAPMIAAAKVSDGRGYKKIFNTFLEKGKVNTSLTTSDGWTVTMIVADKGNQEMVLNVMDHCALSPNLQSKNFHTLLMIASIKGYEKVVARLLEDSDTNTELRNINGQTAFMLAEHHQHEAITQLLKEHASNIATTDSRDSSVTLTKSEESQQKEAIMNKTIVAPQPTLPKENLKKREENSPSVLLLLAYFLALGSIVYQLSKKYLTQYTQVKQITTSIDPTTIDNLEPAF